MAITHVEIIALHCDQGMGTLLKVYDDSVMNDLAYLALFDLGSDSKDWFFTGDALDTVCDALEEKYDHKLNVLTISHQDYDHWSLLDNLRGEIERAPWAKSFKLGQIYRGGLQWSARATKEFNAWVTNFKVSGVTWTDFVSDYHRPGKAGNIDTYDDEVYLELVVVNTASRRAAEGYVRNGSSVVVCVRYAGNSVLLPGDATSETLNAINDLWDLWANAGDELPIVPCIVLSVPHHGSLLTISDNFNSKKPNLSIASLFAENLQARRLAASAGTVATFGHPSYRVLKTLYTYKQEKETPHSFIAFKEADRLWYQYDNEKLGIFTTIDTVAYNRRNVVTTLFPNGNYTFSFDIRGPAVAQPPDEHVIARPAEHFER